MNARNLVTGGFEVGGSELRIVQNAAAAFGFEAGVQLNRAVLPKRAI